MFIICIFYGIISLVSAHKIYYCSGKKDDRHYCSYTVGDPHSNIIINSPHGGELHPKEMRKRKSGCLVDHVCRWEHDCGKLDKENCQAKCITDHFAGDITKQFTSQIEKITGRRPHLIVNEVQRAYFDGNREIREATFGDPAAIKTFHEYHDFIRNATDNVKKPALFIEMHGQRFPTESIEIGYMITSKDLDEGTVTPRYSSIRSLFQRSRKYSFEEMVQGNKSLGYLLQRKGYKTIPSPNYPGPGSSGYYTGGYNVQMHTPMWNSQIDALQIEIPNHLRNPQKIKTISNDLADALVNWMKVYYDGQEM